MSQHSRAPSLASSSLTVNGHPPVDGPGGVMSSTASVAASITSAAPSELGSASDTNSIASLVYSGSRDPRTAGYKAPTTRDIPQIKLLRIEAPDEEVVDRYLRVATSVPAPLSELEPVDVPPLELVPDVFFGEDFELDNPRVFDIVTGVEADTSEDDGLLGGRETLLHDKLSWYVDVVEMHLISEISKASGSFFSATASFHEIEHRAASLGEQIKEFHSELSEVKTGVVQQNNETVALLKRLEHVNQLSDALEYIKRFLDGMDKLRDLLISDVVLAKDQLEIMQTLASSPGAPVQLQSLRAMAEVFGELDMATDTIQDHYINLISDTILDDLRNSITTYESQVVSDIFVAKTRRNITTTASQLPQELLDQVESSLKAVRNGPDAIGIVSERVTREVKSTIRSCLPPQDHEDSQLARSLHYLQPEAAEEMCVKLFSRVLAVLLRLRAQQIMLVNIVPCAEAGGILSETVKSADSRLVRVLKVRKDSTAVLSPPRFARFYALNDAFIKECEEISGVWPPEVGEFLVVQTQLYLHTYHSSSRQSMEEALNTDNWRRDEISDSLQATVNCIVESELADPGTWLNYTKLDVPIETEPAPADDDKHPLNLFIEGDAFFISRGTARTIQIIGNYAVLIALMPGKFSSDFSMMLADLVGEYNGRVRSLVLGFGATKTAGLKHISVRHLTLASESLRAVVKVMGYVLALAQRHAARDRLSQVESQLEQVTNSLKDHEAEIHRKLVKLMADKITVSCRTIAATDWSRAPADGEEANKYMKDLVKDTQTVVRIVEDVMPAQIASGIVSEVFAAYKARLLDAYCRVQLRSQREKDNLMLDLSYFRSRAGQFTGAGNVADVVYEAVNNFASPVGYVEPLVEERRSMSSETDRSARLSVPASPARVKTLPDDDTPLSALNGRTLSKDNLTEVRKAAVESDENGSDNDISLERPSFDVSELGSETPAAESNGAGLRSSGLAPVPEPEVVKPEESEPAESEVSPAESQEPEKQLDGPEPKESENLDGPEPKESEKPEPKESEKLEEPEPKESEEPEEPEPKESEKHEEPEPKESEKHEEPELKESEKLEEPESKESEEPEEPEPRESGKPEEPKHLSESTELAEDLEEPPQPVRNESKSPEPTEPLDDPKAKDESEVIDEMSETVETTTEPISVTELTPSQEPEEHKPEPSQEEEPKPAQVDQPEVSSDESRPQEPVSEPATADVETKEGSEPPADGDKKADKPKPKKKKKGKKRR